MSILKRLFGRRGANSAQPIQIVIYSRPECHLCETAEEVVRSFEGEFPMSIEVIDISGLEELEEAYGLEIPVVFIDGEKCFRHRAPRKGIERRLSQAMKKSDRHGRCR